MPDSINELIEAYIETRHLEYGVERSIALNEVVIYRIGIESAQNPLTTDNRFTPLREVCDTDRGKMTFVDDILLEECEKIGELHKLKVSIEYGDDVINKINAFMQKQVECRKHHKPFVLKVDMERVSEMNPGSFKSLMYCIQQFKPELDIRHLFAVDDNKNEAPFIESLPSGLAIHIRGVKAEWLILERTVLLFKAISQAQSLSLTHSALGRWTTKDIEAFKSILLSNQNLTALDLSHNELFRWSDQNHPQKLALLNAIISKPGLEDVNINHNQLDQLMKEEKETLRNTISEALKNGLCKIHAPRFLISPGFTGLFRCIFSSPDKGKCSGEPDQKRDVSLSNP